MAKIGLMGGTFNPIHNAHLALAQAAYEYCGLDQVWFMPSGRSYLKKDMDIPSGEVRADMVRLAIRDIPYFSFCDLEIKRPGNTYTADTLEELNALYPADEFYFLMGADSAFYFSHWYHPERIAALCTLGIVGRPGKEDEELMELLKELKTCFQARIVRIPFREQSVSSSMIREMIKKGNMADGLIPEPVADYIRQNGLYTSKYT
ncbi:MAG: nicotinate-nucleotide adenylyltransferase [Lachnospiraceae bacterium]|nr:nicotinate-nucleotide adenylyltransferase [Lachnospiraceae bacterium]